MTLDEAIEHALDVANSVICKDICKKCADEHMQLAKWLTELKEAKKNESND